MQNDLLACKILEILEGTNIGLVCSTIYSQTDKYTDKQIFIHKQTNIHPNRYSQTYRKIYRQIDIYSQTDKYTPKQISIYIYILHNNINKYVHGYAYIQI